jgi:hypothetical protein
MQDKKQKSETKSRRSLTTAVTSLDVLTEIATFLTAVERARSLGQVSRVWRHICTTGPKAAVLYKLEVEGELQSTLERAFEPDSFAKTWASYLFARKSDPNNHKDLCYVLDRYYRPDKHFFDNALARKKDKPLPRSPLNPMTEAEPTRPILWAYKDVRDVMLGQCLMSMAVTAPLEPTEFGQRYKCIGHAAPRRAKNCLQYQLCPLCKAGFMRWAEGYFTAANVYGPGILKRIHLYWRGTFHNQTSLGTRACIEDLIRFIFASTSN